MTLSDDWYVKENRCFIHFGIAYLMQGGDGCDCNRSISNTVLLLFVQFLVVSVCYKFFNNIFSCKHETICLRFQLLSLSIYGRCKCSETCYNSLATNISIIKVSCGFSQRYITTRLRRSAMSMLELICVKLQLINCSAIIARQQQQSSAPDVN